MELLLLLQVLRDEAMKGIEEDDNLENEQERETAREIVGRFLDIAEQTVPLDDQKEEAREVLGDPLEVALGIDEKAVYLSFGKDSTDLLKNVIDKSLEDAENKFAPVEVIIALTPILEFASSIDDNPGVQSALESLKEAGGKDRITLKVMPIRRGVSVRFEVEEGVLSAAGEAAKALQPLMAAGRKARKKQP